nr:rab proteins geranylgeranyltransferase component A 1 isoform X1 [Onthophagus taurus]XP_022900004.1 rab proteins geranylgeranyltransferase component A 1 isoform X2 [Onthophagus taurus]
MDYELPTNFDLIVVGTGVVESMVSAAASRIGKTVLQIDSKDYYGGDWASFNLETIQKLISMESNEAQIDVNGVSIEDDEVVVGVGNDIFNLKDVEQTWNIIEKFPEKNVEEDLNVVEEVKEVGDNKNDDVINEGWSQEKLLKENRKFNIDISPKVQFARGDFVELLISSNIARYSEYRSVSRVLTYLNNQLEIVPCSRSDVFSNTKVSVIEKRMLMKLLTACLDGDENEFRGYENKTFFTYLKDKKLTENVIHYVLYAIAMCTIETLCPVAVQSVKRFVTSLGRFGKTPFLYSMYGSGELSQAFCRLSAVFGGVYALNQKLNGFIFDKGNDFKGIICGKQRINGSNLVMGVDKAPKSFVGDVSEKRISRGIFVIDRSIMSSEKEHLTLLLFPNQDGKRNCNVIEMGSLTGTCPKDILLLHMFIEQNASPKEDLNFVVEKLFKPKDDDSNECPPNILWSFYYSTSNTNDSDLTKNLGKNVFLCPGPDMDLDIDGSIKKAKKIFNALYTDCEFLPRAPDPEELIIGEEEEDEKQDKEGNEKDEINNDNVKNVDEVNNETT